MRAAWPADPRGHHLDREVRDAGGDPPRQGHQGHRGAERPPPRAGSPDRRRCRRFRRRHHRHQHGRPRYRHPARRQPRDAHRRRRRTGLEGAERDARIAEIKRTIAEDKAKVLAAGGLYIIGTERHESRRIDNQLRGRAGRQGDPGHSKFFLSLQDDLMRIFPVESMDSMLSKLGLEQGESITHPWVTKAIERAQARVEARNFDIRKNILQIRRRDERSAQGRSSTERLELMDKEDVAETVNDMRHQRGGRSSFRSAMIPERAYPEQWHMEQLVTAELKTQYLNLELASRGLAARRRHRRRTGARAPDQGSPTRRPPPRSPTTRPTSCARSRKSLLLQAHRSALARAPRDARPSEQGGGLARSRRQRDPLNEYKSEAYELFQQLLSDLRELGHQPAELRRDPDARARTAAAARHEPLERNPRRSDHRRERCRQRCHRHLGRRGLHRRHRRQPSPGVALQSMGAGTIEQDADAATRSARYRPIDPALLEGVSATPPALRLRQEVQALPRRLLTPR